MDWKKKKEEQGKEEDLSDITRRLKSELQVQLDPGLKQRLPQLRTHTAP